MERLNFFFDVDGTLLPFGKGLPESALKAILDAKAKGHRIFVSTGRSPLEMDPRLSPIPFDGGVYAGGCTVIYQGKTVYRRRCTEEERETLLSYLEKEGILSLIQCDEGTYASAESFEYFKELLIKANGNVIDVPGLVITDHLPVTAEISKIVCVSPSGEVDKIRKDLEGPFHVIDNTLGIDNAIMCEICLPYSDKGSGIRNLMAYLKEDMKTAVGVGDGANDVEMIEYCGLGIAMGNASECAKEAADYVTTSVESDGIKNAIDYALGVYLGNNH